MCKNYVDLNKDREEKIRDIIRKKEEFYYHGKKLNLIKTHEELMNWRPQYTYKEGVIEGQYIRRQSLLKKVILKWLELITPMLFLFTWVSIPIENVLIFISVSISLVLLGSLEIRVEEK